VQPTRGLYSGDASLNLLKTVTSRRALLLAAAVLAFGLVKSPAADAAAKHAPKITGDWVGTLHTQNLGDVDFTMTITKQSKKTGKFSGEAQFNDQSVQFSGKIKPNGKVSTKFDTTFSGLPITVSLKLQTAADGNSSEGTFEVTSSGQPLDSGAVEMEKTSAG
jgi:hypothetical protein